MWLQPVYRHLLCSPCFVVSSHFGTQRLLFQFFTPNLRLSSSYLGYEPWRLWQTESMPESVGPACKAGLLLPALPLTCRGTSGGPPHLSGPVSLSVKWGMALKWHCLLSYDSAWCPVAPLTRQPHHRHLHCQGCFRSCSPGGGLGYLPLSAPCPTLECLREMQAAFRGRKEARTATRCLCSPGGPHPSLGLSGICDNSLLSVR